MYHKIIWKNFILTWNHATNHDSTKIRVEENANEMLRRTRNLHDKIYPARDDGNIH